MRVILAASLMACSQAFAATLPMRTCYPDGWCMMIGGMMPDGSPSISLFRERGIVKPQVSCISLSPGKTEWTFELTHMATASSVDGPLTVSLFKADRKVIVDLPTFPLSVNRHVVVEFKDLSGLAPLVSDGDEIDVSDTSGARSERFDARAFFGRMSAMLSYCEKTWGEQSQ